MGSFTAPFSESFTEALTERSLWEQGAGNREHGTGSDLLLTLANVDTREDSLVSVALTVDVGLRDAGEKRCIIWPGVAP